MKTAPRRQNRAFFHLLVFLVSAAVVISLAEIIMWGLAVFLKPVIPLEKTGVRVLLSIGSMVIACFVAAWGFSGVMMAIGLIKRLMAGKLWSESAADIQEEREEFRQFRQMFFQSIPTPEMIREHLQLLKNSPAQREGWRERYRMIATNAKDKGLPNWQAYKDACESV